MRVWVVRHGETQANRDGIIQGQMDVPLNEEGLRQAEIVAQALKGRLGNSRFDFAYTSDLSRAAKTAEVILRYHPGVEIVKQDVLRERFMGALQGEHFRRFKTTDPETQRTIETTASFKKRAIGWWNKTIVPNAKRYGEGDGVKNVLVTSHGGFITTLVHGLIGSRKAECGVGVTLGQCKNTAICVIDVDDCGKGVVLEYGNVQHLDSAVELNADLIDNT
ncbi:phosphoglycerate mutase-like protein [Panaeolus papilionaceus]|nr:phosphoglycerate mutase-like protein [Panaeolus papilionaceus]